MYKGIQFRFQFVRKWVNGRSKYRAACFYNNNFWVNGLNIRFLYIFWYCCLWKNETRREKNVKSCFEWYLVMNERSKWIGKCLYFDLYCLVECSRETNDVKYRWSINVLVVFLFGWDGIQCKCNEFWEYIEYFGKQPE